MEFKDSTRNAKKSSCYRLTVAEHINGGGRNNEIKRSNITRSSCPSSKEADDLTIRRFLRALDMDVEKGCTMLLNCLRWWRRAFVPNGFISESENPSQLAKNNLCLQGVDKKGRGRLVLVGFGSRHKPTDGTLDEFKRFAVYCLDKISAKLPKEQEKFACIADFEGWGTPTVTYVLMEQFYPSYRCVDHCPQIPF
ncbi:random slug protein 5 [Melia azedarach]|uniref:Random slug protein 5 n=1 Tax=Melia azedarach TaxID=155640 RepID=A0ACC1Y9T1_MELAZ|nr:random slug protein 5 [Melia azedarach]